MHKVKKAVQRLANRFGIEIRRIGASEGSNYAPVHPDATYSPWLGDTAFQGVYRQIREHTLVDVYRCYEIWTIVEQVANLSGDIIEIGVWRGGSGALIAKRAEQLSLGSTVFLCDTFRGIVKAGENDPLYRGGELADTSEEMVRSLVNRLQLKNVRILAGVFPDETAHLLHACTFRLCHVDVDVYESARDILEWIWRRMVVGGIVMYDDYGFETCAGIATHVNEQRQLPDRVVIHNLNGHAIVIKTA